MKIFRNSSLPIIFMLIFICGFSANAKDEWTKVKSKNFTLVGNAKEKSIRDVATKLEQFRYVFNQLFPTMSSESHVATTVVVFKNKGSFKPYKSIKWASGYFQSGEDVNYIALSLAGEREDVYSTIFHEYIHYLVNNNSGSSRIPPWFNEGIAEYYDRFVIKDDQKVTLGGLNESHLYALQRTKLIPFETFFNIDQFSLSRQGDHSANIFYAQAWALMHYLIQGNDGKRIDQLSNFLKLVISGKDPKEAFQTAFKVDYRAMEDELEDYVRKNTYKASFVTFKNKLVFDDQMQSFPMSEAQSKAYLGDLLYHIRKYEEADKMLAESLAIAPDLAMANTSMGLVKMRAKKFGEAKKYLEKAARSPEANYLTLYHYAYVLSREGADANNYVSRYSSEIAGKMRDALRRSISLNPSFPANYDLLAYLSLVTNENLDEGIDYLKKAIALSPGNEQYPLNLANLYTRKGEIDKAIPILESVFRSTGSPEIRSFAETRLSNLRRMQEQLAAAKEQGYSKEETSDGNLRMIRNRPEVITAESPEELEKRIKESKNRSINQILRKPLPNEKRLLGYLSNISCSKGNVIYTIKTDKGIVKTESKDFTELHLMYINVDIGDLMIGCDTIKKDLRAVITYMPHKKTQTAGVIKAIEFISEDFSLIGN